MICMVFVHIQGVKQNSDGYIIVNSEQQTNIPHIYALGTVTGNTLSDEGMHVNVTFRIIVVN